MKSVAWTVRPVLRLPAAEIAPVLLCSGLGCERGWRDVKGPPSIPFPGGSGFPEGRLAICVKLSDIDARLSAALQSKERYAGVQTKQPNLKNPTNTSTRSSVVKVQISRTA